ncbi:MAG TPA: chemotaxis protein CheW [Candidatus Deferrimicrobiaceae bacterium]
MEPFFLFSIEEHHFALELPCVERVVSAVAVTPLSEGPGTVLGVINLHGKIIPVVDLRGRLGFPPRQVRLDDTLVIAHTARRKLAFFADAVEGVIEGTEGAVTNGSDVVPGLEFVQGVMQVRDNLVLIHDLDRLLSIDDQEKLEHALGEAAVEG